jgi:phosphoribosylformylglycinamidine (FGAM) synthase-like amidotransferase family enzyme
MVCIESVVHFKNTHTNMNGFPHIIDEINNHGKNVMPSMGHPKIKKR